MLYVRNNEMITPELETIFQNINSKPKHYSAGSPLFREGDVNDHIVILLEGIVKVIKIDIDGNHKLIGLGGANELMGFTGFFTKKNYSASVISVTDVSIHELYYNELMEIIDKFPKARNFLYQAMDLFMEYYINISIIQSYNSIESQLARILSNLSNKFGMKKADGSIEISMKLTDEMLGSIIGTNRETVTRVLSKFKNMKLLSKKNKIITIHEPYTLQSLYGLVDEKNISC